MSIGSGDPGSNPSFKRRTAEDGSRNGANGGRLELSLSESHLRATLPLSERQLSLQMKPTRPRKDSMEATHASGRSTCNT